MGCGSLPLLAFAFICAALAVAPASAAADGCKASETTIIIRGDEFQAIPIIIRSGGIRVGALELSFMGSEAGWTVSRPVDAGTGASSPATQITINKEVLEIRSLDRRLGSVDESPDVILTAVASPKGLEIRVSARGSAKLEVTGQGNLHNPREVAFSCDGISLSPRPSVI